MKRQDGKNNIETKKEKIHVGASIARPNFEEYTVSSVGAILIASRPIKKCLKQKQAGITLIALVITIIVLLILSAVTINLTLGERGIFNTAKKAVENYKDAEERELANLNNFQQEAYNTINGIGNSSKNENCTVTSITLQPNKATIKRGEKITITANINPANATNKTIEFISGNEDIVTIGEQTINEDGTVSIEITGIKEGNTTIMAKSKHGENGKEITQSCTIEITTNIVYIYNEGVFNSNFPVQEINITIPDPNHHITQASYIHLHGFITKDKINISNYSKICRITNSPARRRKLCFLSRFSHIGLCL